MKITAIKALVWLRMHNSRVRFHSNGTVEVTHNFARRRRKTLAAAIFAHDPKAADFRCTCPSLGSEDHLHAQTCAYRYLIAVTE